MCAGVRSLLCLQSSHCGAHFVSSRAGRDKHIENQAKREGRPTAGWFRREQPFIHTYRDTCRVNSKIFCWHLHHLENMMVKWNEMKNRITREMQIQWFSMALLTFGVDKTNVIHMIFKGFNHSLWLLHSLLNANLIFIAAYNSVCAAVSKHILNVLSGFSLNTFFFQNRRKNWNQECHRQMINSFSQHHGTLPKSCDEEWN